MKQRNRRTSLIACAALLCAGMAGAQQQRAPFAVQLDAEEEEEVRRYFVELIVFEYLDSAGGAELFEPDQPAVPEPDELPLSDVTDTGAVIYADRPGDLADPDSLAREPATDDATNREIPDQITADQLLLPLEEVPTLEKAGFRILDPDEYQLDDIFNQLRRLGAYRPLMRGAWIQPALEQEESVPLKLRRIGNPPLRLDGTVTLYLSRFLHLVVDLSLEEKSPARPMDDGRRIRYFGDERANSRAGVGSMFISPSIFYRIQEDRILRSGELRYYDHPRFGVLAQVMRIEEETPESMDGAVGLSPANR